MSMNLSSNRKRIRSDASGNEGRESGGVDWNTLLVNVIQNGESFFEFVLASEVFDVFVNEKWVFVVEW